MTKERQYLDFYLQLRDLDRLAQNFKVAVLPSPGVGESREATTVNYNYDELAESLSRLEHRAINQKSLIQLGEHLANLLLPPGEIRNLFEQVMTDAGQDGGVRLRLLTSEPELARLPWEYTYLPLNTGETGYRHFLVLNPQISLVRHEPIAKKHPKVEGIDPKQLRLLVAMANPNKDLNLEREKNNLTKVLEGFSVDDVTLEWQPLLENVTIGGLKDALMKKPELFYFAGHGSFNQEGYIVLQKDASGATYSMSASELGLQLKQAGVRVAVFGTCESARRDGASEWAGVAPTLVAEGVPVVVAMQYEVLDNHAIAFSETFYAALAAGLSVDEAVAAGRLAMLGQDASNQRKLEVVSESSYSQYLSNEKPANAQWGVPVLYMRSADSIIFPRKTSAVAEEIRRVIQLNIGSIKNGSNFTGLKVKRAKGPFEYTLNLQEGDNSNFIATEFEEL
ncbi:CHAT domain-containing protein [Nostoc sp. CCY 9925]|uniref:CHAT domain-containing protein n=1 Tax=Nostoc sp. CCY 9925 TaxID=3103865 RepID=UPI0039C68FF5